VSDLGEGVEIDGLVHAYKDEIVIVDAEMGGRMCILDGGLAL
jgi:hypothetical protein